MSDSYIQAQAIEYKTKITLRLPTLEVGQPLLFTCFAPNVQEAIKYAKQFCSENRLDIDTKNIDYRLDSKSGVAILVISIEQVLIT